MSETGLTFEESDGGRAAAGFAGEAGDCLVRAVVHMTGRDFAETWKLAEAWNRSVGADPATPDDGVENFEGFLRGLGFRRFFVDHENPLPLGHFTLRLLGRGRYLAVTEFGFMDHHAAAVVDNVLLDTWDSRCLPDTDSPAPVLEAWRLP